MTVTMKKTLGILLFGLVAGCAGAPATVSVGDQAIDLTTLPNLPGCLGHEPDGTLSARAVKDADDLFVLFENGEAQCIDSSEGFQLLHLSLTTTAGSNPMPGQPVDKTSSNPMPGNPGDPAASNPMPGNPGDPGGSNPMPGHPSYESSSYSQTR